MLILVVKNVNHFVQEEENEGTTRDITNLHVTGANSKCVDIIYKYYVIKFSCP